MDFLTLSNFAFNNFNYKVYETFYYTFFNCKLNLENIKCFEKEFNVSFNLQIETNIKE